MGVGAVVRSGAAEAEAASRGRSCKLQAASNSKHGERIVPLACCDERRARGVAANQGRNAAALTRPAYTPAAPPCERLTVALRSGDVPWVDKLQHALDWQRLWKP